MRLHSVRSKDNAPARIALHQPILPELRRAHDSSLIGSCTNRLQTHILTTGSSKGKQKSYWLRGYNWPEGS